MTDPRPDPEALADLETPVLGRLRGAAADAGYDGSVVAGAESAAPGHLDAVRLPLVHAWLRGEAGPGAIWARLFAYRDAVEPDRVRAAVGDDLARALLEAEILVDAESGLRSRLRLMPFADLLIGSDEADARFDPVMGPGATTLELWRAMAVPDGGRVLDVGCGAGSLALAAARHGAREAVGVDIDPRAIAYSRFNARLNALGNVSFERGDLLAPVRGQHFDLVVAQPPFIMRPPRIEHTTLLHGGERGDELALTLLPQIPDALGVGGHALVLLDTSPPHGQTAVDRVAQAMGTGEGEVQVIAIDGEGHDADRLAIACAASTHSELGPAFAAAAQAYREHLRELGISRVRHVLVDLRRPAPGEPLFVASIEPRGSQPYRADALAEVRDGLDLAATDDAALLSARIRLSPHARLEERRPPGEAAPVAFAVRFEAGRARDQELSEAAAALIDLAARASTPRAVVEGYAEVCRTTPAAVEGAVLSFIRDALVSGLIVRAKP